MKCAERLAAKVSSDSRWRVRVPEFLAQVGRGDNLQFGAVDVLRKVVKLASSAAKVNRTDTGFKSVSNMEGKASRIVKKVIRVP